LPRRAEANSVAEELNTPDNVKSMAACLWADFNGVPFSEGERMMARMSDRQSSTWYSLAAAAIDHIDYLNRPTPPADGVSNLAVAQLAEKYESQRVLLQNLLVRLSKLESVSTP